MSILNIDFTKDRLTNVTGEGIYWTTGFKDFALLSRDEVIKCNSLEFEEWVKSHPEKISKLYFNNFNTYIDVLMRDIEDEYY